jgi:hypothetical protein
MRLAETDERLGQVAEMNGKIVGLMLASSQRAKLRDHTVLVVQGTDGCVHPDYRELGVMTALRRLRRGKNARRHALILGGQAGHQGMVRSRRSVPGQRFVFGNRAERFVRPLTWRAALSVMKLRRGRPLGKLAAGLLGLAGWLAGRARKRLSRRRGAWTISSPAAFDERLDAFFEEAAQPFEFILVRDFAYMSWRYNDPRAGVYTILLAEGDGHMLGYAVLAADARTDKGYIADVLTLPGRLDVARSLIEEALAHFRRAGLAQAECLLPGRHPYRAVLDELGFVQRRGKEALAYRPAAAPEDALAFLRDRNTAIHHTAGDTDRV